jgi:hypothetical protein
VLKKTIALAAGLSLLTGCIASKEFENLNKTLSKGTLLARSLTVSNPQDGNTKVTNFLGWISLSGTAPSKLERFDGTTTVTINGDLSKNSYSDDDSLLNPGQNYLYSLTFAESVATQSIVPALLPDTRLTSTEPQALATVPANTQPVLKWERANALPKGFVVTVARMSDDPNGGFSGGSLSGGSPTYIAFLDAASHSTEVKYGTPSDLAAITGDQLLKDALKAMPGNFFAEKNEPLTKGVYAWTVVALDHDDAKTAFAIGKPDSLGIFRVPAE